MASQGLASRAALVASIVLASVSNIGSTRAETRFSFGIEIAPLAARQPGSKRIPDLDIGENGEAVLELWCKGGKGQFSVAGNTVIFVVGRLEDRGCPSDRARLDDELVATLSEATTWTRQGDVVSFIGAKT